MDGKRKARGRCSAAPRTALTRPLRRTAAVPRDPPRSRRRRRLRPRTPAGLRLRPRLHRRSRSAAHRACARLRGPSRARQQPLGFPRHIGLLEMVDQLHRRFALGFPHRLPASRTGRTQMLCSRPRRAMSSGRRSGSDGAKDRRSKQPARNLILLDASRPRAGGDAMGRQPPLLRKDGASAGAKRRPFASPETG